MPGDEDAWINDYANDEPELEIVLTARRWSFQTRGIKLSPSLDWWALLNILSRESAWKYMVDYSSKSQLGA